MGNRVIINTCCIINSLLLINEQFDATCSQLNEGQQYLFSFIKHYKFHYKLAQKNNELPPNSF